MYLTHENKANENKVLSHCEAFRYKWNIIKTIEDLFCFVSNLQTLNHFKLDLKKMDKHAGGKWFIHGTKHCNDNQLQAWNAPAEYPGTESKHDIKES